MKHFIDDYFSDEYGNLYSKKYDNLRKLKPYINHRGYIMYRVCIDGQVKTYSAHHISYWTNVEPFDLNDGLQIDHIDTNRLNNHYSNLRRVTAIENRNNPITYQKVQEVMSGNTHSPIIEIDLEELYSLSNYGMSQRQLAKHFNCSRSTIKSRLSGKLPKRLKKANL